VRAISGRAALAAGFDLIKREPGALFVWAAVYFVLSLVPALLVLAMMGPLYAEMLSGNFDPQSPALAQVSAAANGVQVVSWAASILTQALLLGAVFRAVLMAEDGGFFHMRLSGREGWLALSLLVLGVLFVLGMVALIIPAAILVGILGLAGGETGVGIGVAIAVVAVLAVGLWAWLRLSMAPVMSFAQRRFLLFESWKLTQGHAWKMFLVVLAIFAIVLVAEGVLIAVALAAANALVPLASLGELFRNDPLGAIRRLAAIIGVAYLGLLVIGTAFYVLYAAAWAQMYRQLAEDPAEVFA
jgi:hypothetical protein